MKILLTGVPGCGKTTAVMNIIGKLADRKMAGFYTEEIREAGVRKGFRWKSLDGAEGVLAHVDIKGLFKVGRYGVDVAGFEQHIVPILDAERMDADLFVIDEIWKMECFSKQFVAAMCRLFASEAAVPATVAQRGGGFISEVKGYGGVKLLTLTAHNRTGMVDEIVQMLSA